MLVLSRQRDETIMIGDEVEITVVDIRGDKVRIGINAPEAGAGAPERGLLGDQAGKHGIDPDRRQRSGESRRKTQTPGQKAEGPPRIMIKNNRAAWRGKHPHRLENVDGTLRDTAFAGLQGPRQGKRSNHDNQGGLS